MINIYVGPTIAHVMEGHRADRHAQILRENYLESWRAGGLTGAIMQISDWSTIGMLLSEARRSEGEITFCTSRADFENRPEGSFGLFISFEGYGALVGDFEALETMSELGVTTFTFSHNMQNLLCTGCNERFGEGGSAISASRCSKSWSRCRSWWTSCTCRGRRSGTRWTSTTAMSSSPTPTPTRFLRTGAT